MKPTAKNIQLIEECICGSVSVDQIQETIRVKDYLKLGIRKKKDKRTGEKFLVWYRKIDECHCNDN